MPAMRPNGDGPFTSLSQAKTVIDTTIASASSVADIERAVREDRELLRIISRGGAASTVALSFDADPSEKQSLSLGDEVYEWTGLFKLFD